MKASDVKDGIGVRVGKLTKDINADEFFLTINKYVDSRREDVDGVVLGLALNWKRNDVSFVYHWDNDKIAVYMAEEFEPLTKVDEDELVKKIALVSFHPNESKGCADAGFFEVQLVENREVRSKGPTRLEAKFAFLVKARSLGELGDFGDYKFLEVGLYQL